MVDRNIQNLLELLLQHLSRLASLGLMANGIDVTYATTKATIGTASTEVNTIFLTAIVRVLPKAPVTIAISNGGVPVTATMTNIKAIKIG